MMLRVAVQLVILLFATVAFAQNEPYCNYDEFLHGGWGPCAKFSQNRCDKCCEQCMDPVSAVRCSTDNSGSIETSVLRTYSLGWRNNQMKNFWKRSSGNGSSNINDEAVYGYCRFCEAVTFNQKASEPYTVIFRQNVSMNPCSENAAGFLCSRCSEGFHHNRKGECVSCSYVGASWLVFMIIELVPITIIFAFLYITRLNIVTGGLNSAIFFAQMITTTMDITAEGFIPLSNITNNPQVSENLVSAYHFLYDVWNLEFFSPFSLRLCLFRADSYLAYFFVEYLTAFYPIVLLGIVMIIRFVYHRKDFKDKCNLKIDIFLGFRNDNVGWIEATHNLAISVLVLSYSKLATVSANLACGVSLYTITGESVGTVSMHDPSITYYSFPLFLFVLIAIIILMLLFAYPFIVLVVIYLREYKHSKKLHFHFLNKLLIPFLELKSELAGDHNLDDTVHFDQNRWIEAVYMILRVCLLFIFVLPLSFIQKFLAEQAFLLIGMMFLIFIQPYKKKWTNRIDMFMLLLLVFINSLSIYQYSLAQGSLPLAVSTFVVQYILIFIPAIWIGAYIIFQSISWFQSTPFWPLKKGKKPTTEETNDYKEFENDAGQTTDQGEGDG